MYMFSGEGRKILVPREIQDVCDTRMPIGTTARVCHLKRLSGEVCSAGKDSACTVQRQSGGWKIKCYRCSLWGFVPMDEISPEQAVNAAKAVNVKFQERVAIKKKDYQKDFPATLPIDFMYLSTIENVQIKNRIVDTLYYFGTNINTIMQQIGKYDVGYSDHFKRVIVPIYQYDLNGTMMEPILTGWTGRDLLDTIDELRLDEKEQEKRIKWLHYFPKQADRQRMYFWAPSRDLDTFNHGPIVVVEDPFSAMKICNSAPLQVNVVAMLSDSINTDFMLECLDKQRRVIFWMDADRYQKSLKYSQRFRAWGLDVSTIYSHHDPKYLNESAIMYELAKMKVFD